MPKATSAPIKSRLRCKKKNRREVSSARKAASVWIKLIKMSGKVKRQPDYDKSHYSKGQNRAEARILIRWRLVGAVENGFRFQSGLRRGWIQAGLGFRILQGGILVQVSG